MNCLMTLKILSYYSSRSVGLVLMFSKAAELTRDLQIISVSLSSVTPLTATMIIFGLSCTQGFSIETLPYQQRVFEEFAGFRNVGKYNVFRSCSDNFTIMKIGQIDGDTNQTIFLQLDKGYKNCKIVVMLINHSITEIIKKN